METARSNRGGFTLIEFLVAIVILMVGLLGLLQAVNLGISSNMQNQLRAIGVEVADAELAKEMAKGYTAIDPTNTSAFRNYTVSARVLNGFKLYSVAKNGTAFGNTKQVNVLVSWRYKNQRYNHGTAAALSQTF